jgi:hypothetical protein
MHMDPAAIGGKTLPDDKNLWPEAGQFCRPPPPSPLVQLRMNPTLTMTTRAAQSRLPTA